MRGWAQDGQLGGGHRCMNFARHRNRGPWIVFARDDEGRAANLTETIGYVDRRDRVTAAYIPLRGRAPKHGPHAVHHIGPTFPKGWGKPALKRRLDHWVYSFCLHRADPLYPD